MPAVMCKDKKSNKVCVVKNKVSFFFFSGIFLFFSFRKSFCL